MFCYLTLLVLEADRPLAVVRLDAVVAEAGVVPALDHNAPRRLGEPREAVRYQPFAVRQSRARFGGTDFILRSQDVDYFQVASGRQIDPIASRDRAQHREAPHVARLIDDAHAAEASGAVRVSADRPGFDAGMPRRELMEVARRNHGAERRTREDDSRLRFLGDAPAERGVGRCLDSGARIEDQSNAVAADEFIWREADPRQARPRCRARVPELGPERDGEQEGGRSEVGPHEADEPREAYDVEPPQEHGHRCHGNGLVVAHRDVQASSVSAAKGSARVRAKTSVLCLRCAKT